MFESLKKNFQNHQTIWFSENFQPALSTLTKITIITASLCIAITVDEKGAFQVVKEQESRGEDNH